MILVVESPVLVFGLELVDRLLVALFLVIQKKPFIPTHALLHTNYFTNVNRPLAFLNPRDSFSYTKWFLANHCYQ